ncbi:MAG: hypothetical protein ACREPM_02640 [Gemmatimonadaceae bacterium]
MQRYGAIVVIGGGCYGTYYVRQLQRAARAGALEAREIVVVDREANCAVATDLAVHEASDPVPIRVVVSDWRVFFAEYLGRAAVERATDPGDAIVPSPLMPHLMGEWLVSRARARFSDRTVDTPAVARVPDVPWERAGADGTHYVSFATWMCPVNCVEPRTCPHTRDTRTWSLPDAVAKHARVETEAGRPLVATTLFCRHRAYGVGMFDTAEVIAADERIAAAGDAGAAEVMINTVSHCHGALTRLVIGPFAGSPVT